MPIEIRRATNQDIPEVVRVIKAVYDEYNFTWDPDDYHADLYDLEAAYDRRGDLFYVAHRDGTILGTAALELFDLIPGEPGTLSDRDGRPRTSGADCSIERLYVHPEARRGGVGRTLFTHIVREAQRQRRQRMEIWSDKRFAAAHALYMAMGARIVGDRICNDPDVSPEWGLILDLASP